MKVRRVLLGAAAALGALAGTGPAAAWAHPLLIAATPQPGLVAERSPKAIALALTEPAVARGSRIRLFGPGGAALRVTAVRGSGGRRTLSVRPRARLRSAVYTVRWSVLGDDGHIVSGGFRFGVAGAGGAVPRGAEQLTGAGGGRGGETAAADGAVRILSRWLGILAASILFGGFVLLGLLRRRGGAREGAADVLRRLAPAAWLLVAVAAAEGTVAGARSGAGAGLDLGLLTASATGLSELVRGAVVAVLALALALTRGRPAARDRIHAGGGAAVLLTYALSGHALAFPSFWALLDQSVHVLAAGLWLGGVVALALVTLRGGVRLADGARAFAPVAGAALGVAIVTGVLAAVREIDHWYFLRWSDYGRVVLVKAALVALVALAAAFAWWRSRGARAPGPRPLLLRAETAGVAGILALATVLSGLAQGRGQPLPAQRGTLFAGPALATALLPAANAPVGLFPARGGPNVVTVAIAPGRPAPRAVRVRLVCAGCGRGCARTAGARGRPASACRPAAHGTAT